MSFTKALCISHGEDSDGLICVALLRRIKDVSYNLVTYDDFEMALASLKPPIKELYICDLNIRKALVKEIIRINRFAKIFVFDHHPTVEGVLQNLREVGVETIHDTKDCASVLLYDYYKNELGFEAGRLAAYAAWSDQFEDGPISSMLIRNYDRQLVQHEALILTHALAQEQTEAFKNVVIENLSNLVFPHKIPDALKIAASHLDGMTDLIKKLSKTAKRLEALAYVEALDEPSIGTVANLLIDSMGVDVGLCYKLKDDNLVNISIRSKRGLAYHLGEITRNIADEHNGFGGGHKRASGASIPIKHLEKFIFDFDSALIRYKLNKMKFTQSFKNNLED